jgi:RimJ/RimL family protein N-acetyltransferase
VIDVALRLYVRGDRAAFRALLGDEDVMRYSGDGIALDPEAADALFDKVLRMPETDPAFLVWAVVELGEYAGHAELKRRAGRSEYELVYFLQRARWGRGLGGRVVDLLLEEARRRGLPFVIATVERRNAASLRILKKRGFVSDPVLSRELASDAYRLTLPAPGGR